MKIVWMLLLSAVPLTAQMPMGGITFVASGFPNLALGVHATTDNAATSTTTVVVSLGTPTAGSTIVCGFSYPSAAGFTSVADNVNTGSYQPAASLMRENNHNYVEGIYYHENAAASATTITLTYTVAGAHARMSCLEIKNTPISYALDSSFLASQALTATNPTSGTTLTPYLANEFLYALLEEDGGTTTAGTNYTFLDTQTATTSAQLLPQYWLQTTATATNAPYSNASAADYSDQMSSFGKQQTGTCGVSTIIDWGGGTNGNVPAAADLYNGTHGDAHQPNADRAAETAYGSNAPGTWVASNTGLKYNTTAYAPLVNTVNCPFYVGSGTTTAAVGVDMPTSVTGVGGDSLTFDTNATTVTAGTCMETTAPTTASATTDVFTLGRGDNSDYANVQWNTNGTVGTWALEAKSGGTVSSTFNWVSNTWYWIQLTYVGVTGSHALKVYSFTGSKCTGTSTLMGTVTSASAAVGPPNTLNILQANANTYATGHDFYAGAVKLDYLHGAAVMP